LAFQRPRPVDAVIVEPSYAFPSAHATLALSFYGYLGYLLVRHASCYRHAVNRLFATLTLVFLLGASRVALGVHYLSDVWSGYLVGVLWLIIGVSLNEWMVSSGRYVTCGQRPRTHRGTLAALVIAALLWYFLFVALHPPGFV
ncbi:MAG: phosphatase PAP2 family protein, partial [Thiogranum sp.]